MERSEVVAILKKVAADHRCQLVKSKKSALAWGRHCDWPWNGIVLSAATQGGSARWERNVQPRYEQHLSWAALNSLDCNGRRKQFETVGRFRGRTADMLERVYDCFRQAGGPEAIRCKLAAMNAEKVIAFWTQFKGIGDKYARNIMMDVYDIRFHNGSFAIDSRIKSLLPRLGYTGCNRYGEQETFLNGLANDANLDSWDLDRLLYQAHDCIVALLE